MTAAQRSPLIVRAVHLREQGLPQDEIARRLDVSNATVHLWLNSPRWTSVRTGHAGPDCQLCEADAATTVRRQQEDALIPSIATALVMRNDGIAYSEIGRKLGVCHTTALKWVESERWADARRRLADALANAATVRLRRHARTKEDRG